MKFLGFDLENVYEDDEGNPTISEEKSYITISGIPYQYHDYNFIWTKYPMDLGDEKTQDGWIQRDWGGFILPSLRIIYHTLAYAHELQTRPEAQELRRIFKNAFERGMLTSTVLDYDRSNGEYDIHHRTGPDKKKYKYDDNFSFDHNFLKPLLSWVTDKELYINAPYKGMLGIETLPLHIKTHEEYCEISFVDKDYKSSALGVKLNEI